MKCDIKNMEDIKCMIDEGHVLCMDDTDSYDGVKKDVETMVIAGTIIAVGKQSGNFAMYRRKEPLRRSRWR